MIYCLVYCLVVILGMTCINKYFVLDGPYTIYADTEIDTNRKGNVFFIIVFLILSLLAAIRADSVGIDTVSYTGIFERFCNGQSLEDVRSWATTVEPGYLFFCYLISKISNSRILFLLINACIIYGGFFSYIKRYGINVMMSVLMFIALFYTSTFNVLRQYVAIGILFFALKLFRERKLLKALILIAVAITFHTSSVLLIPIFFVFIIPNKGKYVIPIEIVILIAAFILTRQSILNIILTILNYQRYINSYHMRPSDSKGAMAYVYILIICIAIIVSIIKKGSLDEDFYSYLILSSIGAFFSKLATQNEMFARVGAGYLLFIVLLFPLVVKELIGEKRNQIAYGIIYGLLLVATYISAGGYIYSTILL